MFEKIKNIEFKTVFKFAWLWILWLVGLFIALLLLVRIYSLLVTGSMDSQSSYYRWDSNVAISSIPSFSSKKDLSSSEQAYAPKESSDYSAWNAASVAPDWDFDAKSYTVSIESNNINSDCNKLLSWIKLDYIKKDNVNLSKRYCSFSIKVLKWRQDEFIAFLKTFAVKDIMTNISNIVKSYINLSDKIEDTKKKIAEIDAQLSIAKSSYDELWNSIKKTNLWAESIDSLGKIITNKAEIINKFTLQKEALKDNLNMYIQQKAEYDEQIKYIDFSVVINEKVLFDFESIKDSWYNDIKNLTYTFNETFKDLTINLLTFMLKTLSVVIYAWLCIFLALFWGKILWKSWKKIIIWNNK